MSRVKNPRPRLGTKFPNRVSSITKRPPTKRLVARRRKNNKKGYFPNPVGEKLALHFNAGNDVNGNPRRLFLVLYVENGDVKVLEAVDEGFHGRGALSRHGKIPIVGEFRIAPSEYRSLLKRFT